MASVIGDNGMRNRRLRYGGFSIVILSHSSCTVWGDVLASKGAGILHKIGPCTQAPAHHRPADLAMRLEAHQYVRIRAV